MAKLSQEDVLKLAKLARLHLYEQDLPRYQKEISAILDYVEQLQKVDVDALEPTYQVTGLTNIMRPDKVKDYGATPQELLKNAPATKDGHIKVHRVLE
jgi:aspartyl-tRNA(Asn)/glutamyl-tRNA(Gln) amidotransferase subunit C